MELTVHPACLLIAKAAVEEFGKGGTSNLRMNIKIQEAIEEVFSPDEEVANPFIKIPEKVLADLPEEKRPNPNLTKTIKLTSKEVTYLFDAVEALSEKVSGKDARVVVALSDALAKIKE